MVGGGLSLEENIGNKRVIYRNSIPKPKTYMNKTGLEGLRKGENDKKLNFNPINQPNRTSTPT
jgi:hypothetical protein